MDEKYLLAIPTRVNAKFSYIRKKNEFFECRRSQRSRPTSWNVKLICFIYKTYTLYADFYFFFNASIHFTLVWHFKIFACWFRWHFYHCNEIIFWYMFKLTAFRGAVLFIGIMFLCTFLLVWLKFKKKTRKLTEGMGKVC